MAMKHNTALDIIDVHQPGKQLQQKLDKISEDNTTNSEYTSMKYKMDYFNVLNVRIIFSFL